jgi:hypothetical protein
MRNQRQRPRGGDPGGVESESICSDPTTAGPAGTGPIEGGPVPVHYKLRWTWDDLVPLTGMSKSWMWREIRDGRMPAPDLRRGRRAGWHPATTSLESLADRQGRRSRP